MDPAPAQPGARGLDRDHEHEHREQRGRELVELEVPDAERDLGAEPACADDAEDRGAADRALEAEQPVGDERALDLRQHAVHEHAEPAGAGAAQRVDRAGLDRLGELGEQLAHAAAARDRDREHRRAGPEAEQPDEQVRPDDVRDRAGHAEHAADHEPDGLAREPRAPRPPRRIGELGHARPEHREAEAGDRRERGAEHADQEALEREPRDPGEELGGEIGAREPGEHRPGAREALPVQQAAGVHVALARGPRHGQDHRGDDHGARLHARTGTARSRGSSRSSPLPS